MCAQAAAHDEVKNLAAEGQPLEWLAHSAPSSTGYPHGATGVCRGRTQLRNGGDWQSGVSKESVFLAPCLQCKGIYIYIDI